MIVENVEHRSQTRLGKLTPKARQDQYASGWGVVEGSAGAGWHGIADYQDGIEFGEAGEKKIRFKEFRDASGKTHDVVFNGMKLREMVCEREHINAKDAYEAAISRRRTAAIQGVSSETPAAGIARTDTASMMDVAQPETPAEAMEAAYGAGGQEGPSAPAKRPHWKTVHKQQRQAAAAAASSAPSA